MLVFNFNFLVFSFFCFRRRPLECIETYMYSDLLNEPSNKIFWVPCVIGSLLKIFRCRLIGANCKDPCAESYKHIEFTVSREKETYYFWGFVKLTEKILSISTRSMYSILGHLKKPFFPSSKTVVVF